MEAHVPVARAVRMDVPVVAVDVRMVVTVRVERDVRIIVLAVLVLAREHVVLQIPMERRIVKERFMIINNYVR